MPRAGLATSDPAPRHRAGFSLTLRREFGLLSRDGEPAGRPAWTSPINGPLLRRSGFTPDTSVSAAPRVGDEPRPTAPRSIASSAALKQSIWSPAARVAHRAPYPGLSLRARLAGRGNPSSISAGLPLRFAARNDTSLNIPKWRSSNRPQITQIPRIQTDKGFGDAFLLSPAG